MREKRGICNLERIDNRALVRDKAREFPFVLGQPLYVGSTQVNINPVAIRRSPLRPPTIAAASAAIVISGLQPAPSASSVDEIDFTRPSPDLRGRSAMPSRSPTRDMLLALAASLYCAAFTAPAHADEAAGLAPPEPATPVLSTTASGMQVYACEYDAGHRLAWAFQYPEALLFDAGGTLVVRHGAGPSWEALDGSRVTGKKLAEAPGTHPGSVPQLLLAATPAATGTLAGVRFVQRLDTAGGTPPAATCTTEHAVGRFPYFARYVFLK